MRLPGQLKEPGRRCLHGILVRLLRLRSREYRFPDTARALVIAPHPDDGALGCGVLVCRKRLRADAVHLVCLTAGEQGCSGHPIISPAELAQIRMTEARTAEGILGVERTEISFLGAPDGRLDRLTPEEDAHLAAQLAGVIARFQPDEIFLPYRHDGSTEHEAASRLVLRSLDLAGPRPAIYEYPIWARWSPQRLLRPLFSRSLIWRVPHGGYGEMKRRAVAAYSSQVAPLPPWTEPVLSARFVSFFLSGEDVFFDTRTR
jgi:LmbE family N-acetylglucosaminyl deacetylase